VAIPHERRPLRLLHSPYCMDLKRKRTQGRDQSYISTIWGDVVVLQPKLVVAVSLTDTYTRIFPSRNAPAIIPAIIDTGFNRTLAINVEHLNKKGVYKQMPIALREGQDALGRSFYEISCHIWFFRSPYRYSNMPNVHVPELLNDTKTIHVFLNEGASYQKHWPPLPLLGLEWLTANNLTLNVDGTNRQFAIDANR
jgi:hypothetical protein